MDFSMGSTYEFWLHTVFLAHTMVKCNFLRFLDLRTSKKNHRMDGLIKFCEHHSISVEIQCCHHGKVRNRLQTQNKFCFRFTAFPFHCWTAHDNMLVMMIMAIRTERGWYWSKLWKSYFYFLLWSTLWGEHIPIQGWLNSWLSDVSSGRRNLLHWT